MKKSVFVFVLLCGFVFSVFGQTTGFKAKPVNGKIHITGYEGTDKNIVIPDEVNGMPIIAIDDNAFEGKDITSVTIGNNVVTIGQYAFAKNRLTSVTIPRSVTTIGAYAFTQNPLESVTLGNSVTKIGAYSFNSDLLLSITIGANVSIDKRSFGDNGFESFYIGVGAKKAGTYSRPDAKSKKWDSGIFTF